MNEPTCPWPCGQPIDEHKAAACPHEWEDLSDDAGADFLAHYTPADVAADVALHEHTRGLRVEHVISLTVEALRSFAELGSVAGRTVEMARPGYATAAHGFGVAR